MVPIHVERCGFSKRKIEKFLRKQSQTSKTLKHCETRKQKICLLGLGELLREVQSMGQNLAHIPIFPYFNAA